jgi:hypothetical protein
MSEDGKTCHLVFSGDDYFTVRKLTFGEFVASSDELYLISQDFLTNRESVGKVHGGTFNENGWKAVNETDYIYYKLPDSTSSGQVEFEAKGFKMGLSGDPRKHILGLADRYIDDASGEKYLEDNSNTVMLRIFYGPRGNHVPGDTRFRIRGIGIDKAQIDAVLDWDENTWYKFKVAWTPTGAQWYRNDSLVGKVNYPDKGINFNHLFLNLPNYKDMHGVQEVTFRNVLIYSGKN